MKATLPRLPLLVAIGMLLPAAALLRGADWPDWRGPARTGVSAETGLASSWSPSGQNLAWKAPYGGRSGPVVFGDRLYLQNTSGEGESMQERLMCFHADTGKLLWDTEYNLFTSDVPPHRIAWASPVVDPVSGNVFAFSGNGLLMSLSRDGKLLWERSLAEEFGMWTTHGGRVSSPIIDGDQLIVSGLMFSWGQHAGGAHRYISFDKMTGEANWISSPEGRPTDTIYANPFVADVNGTRTFFSGGSDGAMHALKINTGEKIWSWPVSQRGLNTAALMVGPDLVISHSEENLGTSEMGMLAAVPAGKTGTLTDKDARWLVRGVQAGYASPVSDGQRIYVVDNGGILFAHDAKTGARAWEQNLGTIQKSSPVLADGKLYVGTENGKFFIIRPLADRAEILDQDWLGSEQNPEPIVAAPAVARGRVYVVSMNAIYAIGPKMAPAGAAGQSRDGRAKAGSRVATGRSAGGVARDAHRAHPETGRSRCADREGVRCERRGHRHARPGDVGGREPEGHGRRRQVHGRPRRRRTGGAGQGHGRDHRRHGPHPRASPICRGASTSRMAARFRRPSGRTPRTSSPCAISTAARCWSSWRRTTSRSPSGAGRSSARPEMSNYTIEADVRGMERRRLMGDIGVVAQRYELVLFGNHQRLDLQPWQPETKRTVSTPFKFDKDVWYTMKLEVQSLDGGRVRARGKVWAKGQPEPQAWTIERVDPIGSHKGSPGLYADAPSRVGGGSELYYDNIKVYKNK